MNKFIAIALFFICVNTGLAYESADFHDDSFGGGSSWGHENYVENENYRHGDYEPLQYAENTREVSQPFYYENHASSSGGKKHHGKKSHGSGSYSSRLPGTVSYGEKVIIVNPRKHVWGAYSADGKLLRAGLATAGSSWCRDIHRACRTKSGTFRIFTLGSRSCKSKRYPLPRGGAPMPYCMFFNGNQGLHGSYELAEANLSHGCVRISVSDAEWVRFNFANIGTKVIVTSY